jgi:FkbM family methyltransferase
VSRHPVQDSAAGPAAPATQVGGSILAALQRVARTRPAQAVLGRPRVERLIATGIEALTVRESPRFVGRELFRRKGVYRYRLRSSGRPIHVRHNTGDPVVLHEVFYEGHYDMPEPVWSYLVGLGRPAEIVDLGANIGLFGVVMIDRLPGSRITGFEPDASNADVHRRTIEANGAARDWRLVEAAASNEDGRVPFLSGEFARSRIDPGSGAGDVEALDVFPYLERADFAKIDIEGGEWPILQDHRFLTLRTPALVLEYHVDLSPGDPRKLSLELLAAAGYRTELSWNFPAQGMVWAWKPELERLRSAVGRVA